MFDFFELVLFCITSVHPKALAFAFYSHALYLKTSVPLMSLVLFCMSLLWLYLSTDSFTPVQFLFTFSRLDLWFYVFSHFRFTLFVLSLRRLVALALAFLFLLVLVFLVLLALALLRLPPPPRRLST
ncbi:hypothetical protein K439DRAFT_1612137 [Ramaria rubella]|nr:hypothetical protein K439DRAFT_1612137 [Ramaria rubella]